MKTFAIIGAGKGLGLSLAKRFGKEGFQVALVARNAEKLQDMVNELSATGIESSYFIADIYSKEQIETAIISIKEKYGQIDVVEVSPVPGNYPPTSVLELTVENARDAFEGYAASSINIVNAVLPDMLERKDGALLFTTGLSAIYPFPMMGNIGVGIGGLRNYLTNLHTELLEKGIFVGHRSLGLFISEPGTGQVGDPDVIADMWFQAYTEKTVWEEEYPKGITPEALLSFHENNN
ncbi:SDR family NAD(P)-dependent oxidoreductase [Cytobacillus kochii]|uniref:Short-chain dehydrogenase n=1 Tax=Cytobacillus kochii TaxID=859143 RepID=A0A248TGH9_9BACI|nr:SDR family NAD(P)-dependent oxidoreductase [Cytobacillus kochii]ASV67210.1 short-chain dehydrogenase [Cytobacillus kochii]